MDELRILAVEDNPADFRLLKEYLGEDSSLRFQVTRAADMKEALEQLSREVFAAVLLDLNLPDSRGLESLQRVLECKPDLPVIVFTGADNPELGLRALSQRAQDYLVKGTIDGDMLIRSLRYAIARGAAEETARKLTVELADRVADLQHANTALNESHVAALNLMQDALEAQEKANWLARFPAENPSPVLRLSIEGNLLHTNPTAQRCAWTSADGRTLAEPLRRMFERVVTENSPVEQDVRLGEKTYSVTVVLFPDERYANLYGKDVTERVQAEQAAARAKEEWERTFDSVPDLMAILDCENRVLRVNRAMADRLGLTPDECVGTKCFSQIRGMVSVPDLCPNTLTLTSGETHTTEIHENRLGGDFLVTTTPLHDETGRIIGAVHIARDITERKKVEEMVRESESRYRSLFSKMTEGFALHEIICDREGNPYDYRFLDINPAFERLTGLKRNTVVGKTVLEIMPATEPIWIERYGRVALTGVPDDFEHFSGELGRKFETKAYRTSPGRFAVIFNDVTELRSMQKREQEDAFRLAWGQSAMDTINAMREGVILMEMDGTIISINPAVEHMTGMTGGGIIGRTMETLLPDLLEGSSLRKSLHGLELLRRGAMPDIEALCLTRADGMAFHVLPSISWMETPDNGRRIIVLTLKNVTELHDTMQSLIESERKYRELVESANSIILRLAPDQTITFFNEYAQRFFGYKEKEVLGRDVVGTIVPETDSQGHDLRKMVKETITHLKLHNTHENENICKDGRQVWIHWANRAIRDPEGNVVEILCVGTDITRRREMEGQARHYQQRLSELAERLAVAENEENWRISRYIHDTIVQNLSLSSIRLGTLVKPWTDAQRTEDADKLRQIRSLLDQAIDECRMVMSDLTPALLYELGLIPALQDLAQRMETKGGTRILVTEDGQEIPLPHSLRGLLFESVRELIMNALKHAGPCEIHVTATYRNDQLSLSVTDDGIGFDAAKPERSPNHKGSFGLFNVRLRVEGMGGRLEVQSVPGRGTTMTICVPLPS